MAEGIERLEAVLSELRAACGATKCHRCGCFRGALGQLRIALPSLPCEAQERLRRSIGESESVLISPEYECLGCAVCWPANALNRAAEAFPASALAGSAACPTDVRERGRGWPPYPGNYRVLDAGGDVAVCVITSERLMEKVAEARPPRVAIVGALYTENLGIERIIANVLANPSLTTLILCGADSRQRLGHLPGQSLLSLMANGLDGRGRIVGALGRRPVIGNVPTGAVEQFRREVGVVDRVGSDDFDAVLETIASLPTSEPRREANEPHDGPRPIIATPPERLVLDPNGYFVVLPDRARDRIVVEHYENGGRLAHVLEGEHADDLCATVIARELVSRLDHAAYLGKELASAERALRTGEPYVQDRAPEPACDSSSGCHSGPAEPATEGA